MDSKIRTCSIYYCRKKNSYICCDSCDEREGCAERCGRDADGCRYCSQKISEVGILCPFFHGELTGRSENERRRLGCEGVIPGTTEKVVFPSGRERALFMCENCCADWEHCPRAEIIQENYGGN